MLSNPSCGSCKYSKVKANTVSMTGGNINEIGYYNKNDIASNSMEIYKNDYFNDYVMSEGYYSNDINKNVGYNQYNIYKGPVYDYNSSESNYKNYIENFENNDNLKKYNSNSDNNKNMNYEIGFNGKLGYSEILYDNNEDNNNNIKISNFENKSTETIKKNQNKNKNKNQKILKCNCINQSNKSSLKDNKVVKEKFGSYFMDISYYNPQREFGFN